ncbi:MAG: CHAP domain-containing protein [Candidatus Saccharimonadales bacterium]
MITSSIRLYSIIAGSVVLTLMLLPVFTLSSLTNLSALAEALLGSQNTDVYLYTGPIASFDKYAFGNCTYWVSLLRAQAGMPIPNTWGNAITWGVRAKAEGYIVNQAPSYGSIMVDVNAPGGLGHVAFVEQVNTSNGSWTISEMNRVGFDEVDTRIMPASAANSYVFIHNKP